MTKAPSIKEQAFCCPHCGAYTSQTWYNLYTRQIGGDHPLPFIYTQEIRENILKHIAGGEDSFKSILETCDKQMLGLVLVEKVDGGQTCYWSVENLNLSQCFVCEKIAVWIYDRFVFPTSKMGSPPNPDLPDDIRRDFEEARSIVNESPRGAAALLRLCVQKLRKHLGQPGRNIDDDIGALVATGLSPLLQQSLDIVRVIGNEAVHPGTLDLKDDTTTANQLFEIINAITAQMISHPKAINQLYSKIPAAKRAAIAKRDSGTKP